MSDILKRIYRIGRSHLESVFKDDSNDFELPDTDKNYNYKLPNNYGTNFGQKQHNSPHVDKELADAFNALEVAYGSSFETCKKSYRSLANKYHSDKWQHDPEKKITADKIMMIINPAFKKIKLHYKKI